ncbi:multidrug efflux SMR transporter [Sphingomonas sp. QA11]|uniref:DMT family transporter n=1 Tax=Sphingomonas sp. QA11 TaxID=2950605 RepID=UPI00234A1797|nr:multidrug efflux SMR transporter [Sphingomonas sp. QA11]WCM25996.1 multidrug efflux SMR transporter [Sphingomonas sp. QA11]
MSSAAAWTLLLLSGLADVAWATSVKMSAGYSRLGWAATSFVLLLLFIAMLGRALEVLPMGTAYAVWTGVGAVGSVAIGIALFGEPVSLPRMLWIAVTLAGIVGLKMTSQ